MRRCLAWITGRFRARRHTNERGNRTFAFSELRCISLTEKRRGRFAITLHCLHPPENVEEMCCTPRGEDTISCYYTCKKNASYLFASTVCTKCDNFAWDVRPTVFNCRYQRWIWHVDTNKSCLQLRTLTTWHCPHCPRHAAALLLLGAYAGTDRRTDDVRPTVT